MSVVDAHLGQVFYCLANQSDERDLSSHLEAHLGAAMREGLSYLDAIIWVEKKRALEAASDKPNEWKYRFDQNARDLLDDLHSKHLQYNVGNLALYDAELEIARLNGLLHESVISDHDGIPAVWVCDLCGQPIGKGGRCNSAIHVGPEDGNAFNGHAIATTDLAAEHADALATIARYDAALLRCVELSGALVEEEMPIERWAVECVEVMRKEYGEISADITHLRSAFADAIDWMEGADDQIHQEFGSGPYEEDQSIIDAKAALTRSRRSS